MTVGTKSLLFGVHQFAIHPFVVLIAWVKLYGWPTWRKLFCVFVHDLGYFGKPNMDGEDSEVVPKSHVEKTVDVPTRNVVTLPTRAGHHQYEPPAERILVEMSARDAELFKKLEKWADDERRSIPGQILHILDQVVDNRLQGAS